MNKRQFKKLSAKTVINETLIPKQTPYCYKVDRDSIKISKIIDDIPTIACPYDKNIKKANVFQPLG